MKTLRLFTPWTFPWLITISTLGFFPLLSSPTGIHQHVEHLHQGHYVQQQPLYLRNRNSFYEKYIRPSEDSTASRSSTNVRAYPDINKDKGNVFKPRPLRPGPWVKMSTGEIWPKPTFQATNFTVLTVDANIFIIKVSCECLNFKLDI